MCGRKLMVVDDQLGIRLLIDEVFSDLGFDVAQAKSYKEAVDIAASFNPDIILVDMRLGVDTLYDGADVIEVLKINNPTLISIAMTGNLDYKYIEKAFMNGACYFLEKPFDIDYLIHLVNEIYNSFDKNQ
jgi:two-component system response regulator (stage 0 sporulation protein F)